MKKIRIEGDLEAIVERFSEVLSEHAESIDPDAEVSVTVTLNEISSQKFHKLLRIIAYTLGASKGTQTEMARVFGISQGTISKVLRGSRLPHKIYGRIIASCVSSNTSAELLEELKPYVLSNEKMRW